MDYCEAGSLAELYEDMDMPFTEPQIVYTCSRVLEVGFCFFATLLIFELGISLSS